MAYAGYWLLMQCEQIDEDDLNVHYMHVTELYRAYEDDQGFEHVNRSAFGRYVKALFPNVTVARKVFVRNQKPQQYYTGLKLSKPCGELTVKCAIDHLTERFNVVMLKPEVTNGGIQMLLPKTYLDRTVYLEISIDQSNVTVLYDGCQLDLGHLYIPSKIIMDYRGIVALITLLSKYEFCSGAKLHAHGKITGDVNTVVYNRVTILHAAGCRKLIQILGKDSTCLRCKQSSSYCNTTNKDSIDQTVIEDALFAWLKEKWGRGKNINEKMAVQQMISLGKKLMPDKVSTLGNTWLMEFMSRYNIETVQRGSTKILQLKVIGNSSGDDTDEQVSNMPDMDEQSAVNRSDSNLNISVGKQIKQEMRNDSYYDDSLSANDELDDGDGCVEMKLNTDDGNYNSEHPQQYENDQQNSAKDREYEDHTLGKETCSVTLHEAKSALDKVITYVNYDPVLRAQYLISLTQLASCIDGSMEVNIKQEVFDDNNAWDDSRKESDSECKYAILDNPHNTAVETIGKTVHDLPKQPQATQSNDAIEENSACNESFSTDVATATTTTVSTPNPDRTRKRKTQSGDSTTPQKQGKMVDEDSKQVAFVEELSSYKCKLCGKCYADFDRCKEHVFEVHNEWSVPGKAFNEIQCSVQKHFKSHTEGNHNKQV